MRRAFAWRTFGRIVVTLIGIGLVCGLLSWGLTGFFAITNVEVIGEGITVEVDAAQLPKNLLLFPVSEVTRDILRDNALVGEVIIKKKYPHTLQITAIARKPFVIVGIEEERYLLDEQGIILKQFPTETGLPLIRMAMTQGAPGEKISDQVALSAVNFLRETRSFISIREIALFETMSLRAQSATMSIVFARSADIQRVARTLQTVLAGFRIKGTLPTYVDLRFDKPVVTF